MYIIISLQLKTSDISFRSSYKTRLQARKNLLKEAQGWLVKTKPNTEWENISHKTDASNKVKYYIKPSSKNEDLVSVYERVENVTKGWIYNTTAVQLVKIMTFSVLDITEEQSGEEPTIRYITAPIQEKPVLTESDKEVVVRKQNVINELTKKLEQRRVAVDGSLSDTQ